MPERLADAIDELMHPKGDERPPEPQIHPDPSRRRPRLIRNTPAAVIAVVVLAAAVAAGWATFWALGLPAVSDRLGLPTSWHLAIRIAAADFVGVVTGALVAWACRPPQTLRRGVRSFLTASRRRTTGIPLFASITAAVLIGLGLAAWATWAISGAVFKHATPATAVDVVKAALPAIAGVLIAVALVVVYRRQKDLERGQFAQRFGTATAQLGDSDVAVRIAGVSAMAAVADESPAFTRRQLCIDVLCGYLRLPYDPDSGANHLAEFVSTTTWSGTPPVTNIEEQRRQSIRQNDREVRKTIVRVISRHLQDNADTSWSANDFDFAGVLFEDASFAGARFGGRHVSFAGATFSGPKTSFDGAEFNAEYVSFDGAKFQSDTTTFGGSRFRARPPLSTGPRSAAAPHSTNRDSPANSSRFVEPASPARKRRFGPQSSSAYMQRSTHPRTGRTSNLTGRTSRQGSTQVIPRCITPRPWPPNFMWLMGGRSTAQWRAADLGG